MNPETQSLDDLAGKSPDLTSLEGLAAQFRRGEHPQLDYDKMPMSRNIENREKEQLGSAELAHNQQLVEEQYAGATIEIGSGKLAEQAGIGDIPAAPATNAVPAQKIAPEYAQLIQQQGLAGLQHMPARVAAWLSTRLQPVEGDPFAQEFF